MIAPTVCIHYFTIAATTFISASCASIGQALISKTASDAINKQPHAHADITRTSFIGNALVETTAILGLFIAAMLLLGTSSMNPENTYVYIAELGILFALCFSAATVGIVSGFPAQEACNSIARQPFFAQKILSFNIMTQALVQTPIIAAFLISFLIKNQMNDVASLGEALRLVASGLCIGLGSIGPAIGLARFAKTACRALGVNRELYSTLLPFTLVSQALIETPIIFALIVSLLILFTIPPLTDADTLRGIALLCAAFSTGIGTLGTGISSGMTASTACYEMSINPNAHAALARASMLGQVITETCVLYAVLISLALIFMF